MSLPILYSFRRCPYAMRARMALLATGTEVRLREVVLRDKPAEMLAASPKGTVPVLVIDDGQVIDESLAIMKWALAHHDPNGWLEDAAAGEALIALADSEFKYHLDRYKYPVRYEDCDPLPHREAGLETLVQWDRLIAANGQLLGSEARLADYAIFPFIRQFANHDRTWFDAQPLPALQQWLQAHLESDLFQTVMKKYPQWHAGDEEPLFAAAA